MADDANTSQTENQVKVQRAMDFVSYYANNFLVDTTAWDLSMTFGEFEKLPDGTQASTQRLSVTVPVGLAKLMVFWLRVQILAYEVRLGKRVTLRADVIPAVPPLVPPELQSDPVTVKMYDEFERLRQDLLQSLE